MIEHRTVDGINYILDTESDLDKHILEHGVFEKHLQDAAKRVVSDDSVILDIGANVGLLTLPFAKMVPHGEVWAFEPDGECYDMLCDNVHENPELKQRIGCSKTVIQDAKHAYSVPFYTRRSGGNRGLSSAMQFGIHVTECQFVGAVTIDEIHSLWPRIDLIKIDVEGAESRVLRGAEYALRTHTPAVIWEYSVIIDELTGTQNTLDAFTFLHKLGYRQFIIQRDGTLEPLNEWRSHLNYADILAVHETKLGMLND